jgi:hypothetical protein
LSQRRQQEEIEKDWRRRVDVPNLLMSALHPPPDKPLEDYCALGDMTAVPVTTVPVTTVPVTTVTADVTDKVLPARVPGGGLDSTKLGPSDDAVGSDTVVKVLAVRPATHNKLSEHTARSCSSSS